MWGKEKRRPPTSKLITFTNAIEMEKTEVSYGLEWSRKGRPLKNNERKKKR